MFTSNAHGAQAVPAIQGTTGNDKEFLDVLDAYMRRELGDGLDRPGPLLVPVPKVLPAEKFSFTVKVHSSWAREADGFCSTLRFLGGECTDPEVHEDELSFTMTIQPSSAKKSPVGDGLGARTTSKFQQC
jgi:hypothetical protein